MQCWLAEGNLSLTPVNRVLFLAVGEGILEISHVNIHAQWYQLTGLTNYNTDLWLGLGSGMLKLE
jgi:hypothetical protein